MDISTFISQKKVNTTKENIEIIFTLKAILQNQQFFKNIIAQLSPRNQPWVILWSYFLIISCLC